MSTLLKGPNRGVLSFLSHDPLIAFCDLHECTPLMRGSERLACFESLPPCTQSAMYASLRCSLEKDRS